MKDEGSIAGERERYETFIAGIGEPQQTGMSIAWFGLAVVEGQFSSSFIDFPWICVCYTHLLFWNVTHTMTSCQWKCSIKSCYCLLLNLLLHVFIFFLH